MSDCVREFVLDTYDTVANPSLWPGVLDRFADMLGAAGCIVFEMEGHGPERRLRAPLFSSVYEADLLDGYLTHMLEWELLDQDKFEAASLATDGVDLIDDSVLFATDAELLAQPNVRQLMEYGLCHRAAGLLNKDNKASSRFSIQLAAGRGRLNPAERSLLTECLPHMAKALDLGRPAQQLAHEKASLMAAMDRLAVGVCILDRQGRAVFRNAEFRRQAEAYGAYRIDPAGRLRLHEGADGARFQALLQDALAHGQHGARPRKEAIATSREGGIEALCIEVAPLDRVAEIGSTPLEGAIVYSMDTSRAPACDTAPMQSVFGLTEAEAALTQLVSQGLTNAQIAARRDRSVDTVNAQVKSVLSKTQCANRTQLVRLLTSFGTDFLRPTG